MPEHSLQAGRMVAFTPKATPTSKTPLHMPPRRREGAKTTLFKVLFTIIAAAFGQGSTTSYDVGNTQASHESTEEKSTGTGRPLASSCKPPEDVEPLRTSTGRGFRSGHGRAGSGKPLQLGWTKGWRTNFEWQCRRSFGLGRIVDVLS